MSEQWAVREIRTLNKIIVEHDGLFPTICKLDYLNDTFRESSLANAYLIATAPLLKAALEKALEQSEDGMHAWPCDEPDCWVEAARAALAASAPPPTADAGAEDGGQHERSD